MMIAEIEKLYTSVSELAVQVAHDTMRRNIKGDLVKYGPDVIRNIQLGANVAAKRFMAKYPTEKFQGNYGMLSTLIGLTLALDTVEIGVQAAVAVLRQDGK